MVSTERRYVYLRYYQEVLGLTDWQVDFEKVSPWQVTNEKVRSNNSLVALSINDAGKKQATIVHTREVQIKDIIHELVHLAHPDWQIHESVNIETQRIMNSKRNKI